MVYLINTASFTNDFFKRIKEAELKIYDSFKIKRGHNHSICARVLLGYILQTYYGINTFSYRYGENGKPYLNEEDIYFSISHSGSYVVCCVSDKEIGCDIEIVKEYNPKIAKRFFTENEARLIENSDNRERIFTRLWTLKESILKKDGTGIVGGLDTYCFADNAFTDEFTAYGCNFLSVSLEGYEFSLCSEKKYTVCDIREVSFTEFVKYINELNYKNY